MKRNLDTPLTVSRTQAEAVLAMHRRIAALLRTQQRLLDLQCIAAYGKYVLSRDSKERIGE